jgi:hypothetical protein
MVNIHINSVVLAIDPTTMPNSATYLLPRLRCTMPSLVVADGR